VAVRLVVAAQIGLGDREVTVSACLLRLVFEPLRGGQRRLLGGGSLVPVSLPVQEREQSPRQLADVAVEAGARGLVHGRQQRRPLGGEPVHRLIRPDQLLGQAAGVRRRHGDGLVVRKVDQVRRLPGGVQIVVKQPVGRGLAVRVAVVGAGEVGGIGPQ
jgi:hypothetical protein